MQWCVKNHNSRWNKDNVELAMMRENKRRISQVVICDVEKSDEMMSKGRISQWRVRNETWICMSGLELMTYLIKACKHYRVPKPSVIGKWGDERKDYGARVKLKGLATGNSIRKGDKVNRLIKWWPPIIWPQSRTSCFKISHG